jgi:putative ABC transport system ATP-binding protein
MPGHEAAAPALEARDLRVRFQGRWVLDGFSLRVESGETVVLRGESGRGKSTLLRCLLGLVVPEAGEIHIGGRRLTPESVWELRTRIGYVPQEPDLGSAAVREWLAQPFSYRANQARARNLERVPELLERLRLSSDLLDSKASDLSGGERQRVALVSALLLDRELLLLDEPTAALDPRNRGALQELLQEHRTRTKLVVSHHGDALPADRVVEMA